MFSGEELKELRTLFEEVVVPMEWYHKKVEMNKARKGVMDYLNEGE